MKKFFLLTPLFLLGVIFTTQPIEVKALTGSDFQAGRIIDDSIFFSGSTMDTNSIQSFLASKVPVCDTNGTQLYGGTTRAAYGTSKGYPPPYTCLKDYSQDTPSKIAEPGLCDQYTGGVKSASQIIYDVGQACGISQKVIVTLLEKEQSLITDDWPWSVQYRSATGYGCPDTAPCDSEYYGFFNQVYNAARQFKRYKKDESTYRYRAYRENYIQYNPDVNCGGSNVYIQNQATAGLYNYTPYQPNPSALNNLLGSGDSCGAYGNRNFWRLYNVWFGSTLSDRPITNMPWNFENLVGGTNAIENTPNTSGLTPKSIIYNNDLYAFHYDPTQKVLKLAKASSTGWSFETIDGDSTTNGKVVADVGRSITATVFNNMLHIFYYNTSNGSLRHGWLVAGGSWSFETLDGSLDSVSGIKANVGMSNMTIEFNGELSVFYYDATRNNLRNAQFSSTSGWRFQNLDGDYGSIAGYNSDVGQNPTATILSGSLQLFYYDAGNGNLRHAWVNPGQSWRFENLDGDYGSIARFNSNVGSMAQALSFKSTLYVFYRDNSSGTIRYSWADTGGWHFATLEGTSSSVSGIISNTGFWPTVSSYGGSVQLFYFDNSQRSLRHAFGVPYL